jgi:hypothetical protein
VRPPVAAAPDAGEEGGDAAGVPNGDGTAAPAATAPAPAQIVIQAQQADELTVANKWSGPVVVSRGGEDVTLQGGSSTKLTVGADEQVTVEEGESGVTFRSWCQNSYTALVSGVPCAITSMPAMSAFTTDGAGTTAGDGFFYRFNSGGSLSSLPAGSFDTSGMIGRARGLCSDGAPCLPAEKGDDGLQDGAVAAASQAPYAIGHQLLADGEELVHDDTAGERQGALLEVALAQREQQL